jgi:hypothetical protein
VIGDPVAYGAGAHCRQDRIPARPGRSVAAKIARLFSAQPVSMRSPKSTLAGSLSPTFGKHRSKRLRFMGAQGANGRYAGAPGMRTTLPSSPEKAVLAAAGNYWQTLMVFIPPSASVRVV